MNNSWSMGYKAGYAKAYAEILEFASKGLHTDINSIDQMYGRGSVKGAEGIPTGPTGYVPNYDYSNMGANGPTGPYN